MMGLAGFTGRNIKLFFKDKGKFFSALISPVILLVLYATFLAGIYRDSFVSALPQGFTVADSLIDATVAGQLISSLLAVSCVTVAFCSNLLSIDDKISGAIRDITVTPVKRSTLALGYFASSAFSTLIINFSAMAAGMVLLLIKGWYMSAADVLLLSLDVLLLSLFGTALASCINFPLSTSGQGSVVGTIVSAGYGFLCGAYMPIASFSEGLQRVLLFLPGTYGTSLVRNHAMAGVYREMLAQGFPEQVVEVIKDGIDCNLYFFDTQVSIGGMYIVLGGAIAVAVGVYVLLNVLCRGRPGS